MVRGVFLEAPGTRMFQHVEASKSCVAFLTRADGASRAYQSIATIHIRFLRYPFMLEFSTAKSKYTREALWIVFFASRDCETHQNRASLASQIPPHLFKSKELT
jgi:hypothetical protein